MCCGHEAYDPRIQQCCNDKQPIPRITGNEICCAKANFGLSFVCSYEIDLFPNAVPISDQNQTIRPTCVICIHSFNEEFALLILEKEFCLLKLIGKMKDEKCAPKDLPSKCGGYQSFTNTLTELQVRRHAATNDVSQIRPLRVCWIMANFRVNPRHALIETQRFV
jgi:hypothetical protein